MLKHMSNKGSKQVGARVPGHIYRWLQAKVDNRDYPNMSQAVIGELTKAKLSEEKALQERTNSAHEPVPIYNQDALIRKQIADILEEMKSNVLSGGTLRKN